MGKKNQKKPIALTRKQHKDKKEAALAKLKRAGDGMRAQLETLSRHPWLSEEVREIFSVGVVFWDEAKQDANEAGL